MSGLSGDALVERAESVSNKEDFAAFLNLLVRNLRDHPEEWENANLEQYLQGLCGFVGGPKFNVWKRALLLRKVSDRLGLYSCAAAFVVCVMCTGG